MTWEYIAGFLDGEGSIVKKKRAYVIFATQTHFGVLESIRKYTKVGNVYPIKKRKPHWKDSWLYSVLKSEEVRYVLENIHDKLIVKRQLAETALRGLQIRLNELKNIKKLRLNRIRKGRKLRDKGWPYRRIAKELGADFGYIRRILLKD